ncbi:MAG: cation-translocating P-type ATPase [Clostridia bacterium]|nr:cation-translocating P-type ATPase [Clostridia bacterium]
MYNKTIEQTLAEVNSGKNGLSQTEANLRLKKFGRNELDKAKRQSFLKCFLKQFLNIMVGILLVAAVVSISIALAKKQYEDLFEGFVILFIVILNALIGVFQENKAQNCLDDLQKMCLTNVKVLRGGVVINIDSTMLVPGDVVLLEAGNIVMADMRLLETNNFSCDESSLTGESVSAEKMADVCLPISTPLAERKNMAYSGSLVTNGKAKGVVVATGKTTELGKIANILFTQKKEVTPLQKSIDKIGKIITWSVLIICAIILIVELIFGNNFLDAVMTSVALAVAAIPESLPAVITIILALGVQQLAKRRCIIKHLNAVETLGSCEIICTDKTGTLTLNKMQVVETWLDDVTNLAEGTTFEEFKNCMQLCNNAKLETNKVLGEPTEVALMEYAIKFGKINKKIIHEIPFSSARKMMTVVTNENGIKCYSKGAPERILERCSSVLFNGQIVPLTEDLKNKIKAQNNRMSDDALRVMGFAYKKLDVFNPNDNLEQGMVFLGLCGMMDSPRPEVKDSVKKCFMAGLKPIMITGDHKRTAFAIAKKIGIAKTEQEVITGEELDKLNDAELRKCCYNFTVYARVSPEHKVRIVRAFKGINKIVAMTGDGVNDAPSLKIADIGVGMGKSGTDVVKNVADMVITDDNFSSIVVAVEEGRKVYSNIQKALQFLISTNCVEVFGMLLALLFFPQYTFLLPAQMLFINLVTDSLPAFALGLEKVEPEVMMSPPRNSKSGLFGGPIGVAIIYQAILQTALTLGIYLIGILCYSPEVASTMAFFTIIFMQTLHSINCKTNGSLFDKNLFDNKTFNFCFWLTMAINLFVACSPFMYTLFGLEFLNFSEWIMVVIFSVSILPLCEIFKLILSKHEHKKLVLSKQKT